MDIDWKDGRLTKAVIRSRLGGKCRIRSLAPLKGKGLKRGIALQRHTLKERTPHSVHRSEKEYGYQLQTVKGGEYVLTRR